ncbi:helix-turn-helix domain-containing protein [Rubritalea marina]|uniref:helix-turn-helix domain-containing protein n=1 Tax=Rubritalea marina TaxID=361055 RepID=UPI00037B5BAD|nr:helix-turn-helix domain-containing protein [Rubritalea marina]
MRHIDFKTDIEFYDSDLYTETAKQWQAEFIQLDRGDFHAKIRQIGMHGTQLGECSLNRKLHQNGLAPQGGRTFIIQKRVEGNFMWRGQSVANDHLLCFPYNSDFESLSPSDFHIYAIHIPQEMLEKKAEAMEFSYPSSLLLGMEVVHLPSEALENFRREIEILLGDIYYNHLDESAVREEYWFRLNNLMDRLISQWLSGSRVYQPILNMRQSQSYKNVIDYMTAHGGRSLKIAELCDAAAVSERSLQYLFKNYLQMSPKQYLLSRKYDEVRRTLRSDGGESVSEVAKKWGFRHMGQFAAGYKARFGELPSTDKTKVYSLGSHTL